MMIKLPGEEVWSSRTCLPSLENSSGKLLRSNGFPSGLL